MRARARANSEQRVFSPSEVATAFIVKWECNTRFLGAKTRQETVSDVKRGEKTSYCLPNKLLTVLKERKLACLATRRRSIYVIKNYKNAATRLVDRDRARRRSTFLISHTFYSACNVGTKQQYERAQASEANERVNENEKQQNTSARAGKEKKTDTQKRM